MAENETNEPPTEDYFPEPVELEINGTLDLHGFRPRDIGSLIPDYFEECRQREIYQVRVVHGKGTGALRAGGEAILQRLQEQGEVVSYRLGGEGAGGWGATVVQLNPGA